MVGGLAMSGEAMPLIMNLDDERLEERSKESERAYKETLALIKGSTYTAAKTATLDAMVAMGRCSDILVLGRPGADPENVAPATVEAALYECARAVIIAPPTQGSGNFEFVVVAWNGSFQAARALEYALPFLIKASKVTLLVAGGKPDDVGASYLSRNLARHGINAVIDAIDPGRRIGPRPRPCAARLHPRQEGRHAGDGRLRSRPGAELPGARRRHRQGDLVLPRAAPDGALMLRPLLAVLAIVLATPALAADLEANKKIVVDFYEKGLNQKDFDAAAKYFGPRYIQHNPSAPDGIEGFKRLVAFLKEKFPNSHSEIKRVIAEGDFVVLHVHSVREPGQRGRAIVDMFRLENGKIVEHWDVIQDIPEKPANDNTMF